MPAAPASRPGGALPRPPPATAAPRRGQPPGRGHSPRRSSSTIRRQAITAKRIDVRIDVTDVAGLGQDLEIAASIYLPSAPVPESTGSDPPASDPAVIFAFPGGGYNRHYYDLGLPGHRGYSQAAHHAGQGFVVVTIDHIGTGDSSVPDEALDYSDIARLNAATVAEISQLLSSGRLPADVPGVRIGARIGLGQSYGGLLLTVLEGEHPTFDGVALLGWSAIESRPRTDLGMAPMDALLLPPGSGLAHPLRAAMHFDDEPEDIVEQDMRGWPQREGVPVPAWATRHMPGGPRQRSARSPVDPGVVSEQAARIACPVFTACGERDVSADLRREPAAYATSPDITLFFLPRASHMHNFASTRQLLWRRIDSWARGVAEQRRAGAGRDAAAPVGEPATSQHA
jgi:pimeloyl-ACP methyl ester carboxylesterase